MGNLLCCFFENQEPDPIQVEPHSLIGYNGGDMQLISYEEHSAEGDYADIHVRLPRNLTIEEQDFLEDTNLHLAEEISALLP